jgi:hypothetical protein
VFLPGKSLVKVEPEILDIFFLGSLGRVSRQCGILNISQVSKACYGDSFTFYMDRGACFSSCGECHVDQLGSISVYSLFLNQLWIASRLVCRFCKAMAGSLSKINLIGSLVQKFISYEVSIQGTTILCNFSDGSSTAYQLTYCKISCH